MKLEVITEKEATRRLRIARTERLVQWLFRIDTLPAGEGRLRAPTFWEAWSGQCSPSGGLTLGDVMDRDERRRRQEDPAECDTIPASASDSERIRLENLLSAGTQGLEACGDPECSVCTAKC